MASFEDRHGRTWSMSITVATVKRVLEATGVNLANILDDKMKPLAELLSNTVKLVDVCWVCCDQGSGTESEFADGLAGDAFERCTNAFLEELVAFFPKRQRETLTEMLEKSTALMNVLADKDMEKLRSVSVADLELAFNSLASSESSRGALHSEN